MHWHKSDRSGDTECVEVGWIKSSRSADFECVEVNLDDVVLIRDTKDRNGPMLEFSKDAWRTFVESLK